MTTTADTVADRIATARHALTPAQAALLAATLAALAFGLVLVQEPGVHDSLHDFRHAAGIVCH